MESRLNIVACKTSRGERPKTVAEAGIEGIINRRIASWKPYYGTYGMGGPGFFGLELGSTTYWPTTDHLVLTLWCAAGWLLLDDEWIEVHPNQYATRRPLYSNFGPKLRWDDVTPRLVGGTIEKFALGRTSCSLTIRTQDAIHVLELPEDTSRLSLPGGSLQRQIWNSDEDIADAWVICDGDLEV